MNNSRPTSDSRLQTQDSKTPPPLKKGDKIAITCPAKKLPAPMTDAIKLLESWGLVVILGETVGLEYHQFAGDDKQRADDLQRFIDDDSIKAIIAAPRRLRHGKND